MAPPDEMDRLIEWARTHSKFITAAVLVVAFGFLALNLQRSGKTARVEVSSQLLSQASTVQALEGLISEYGGTKAAALAKLRLGALHYSENNYAGAEAAFQRFIAEHGNHPMVNDARIGLFRAKSALGQHTEALAGFEAFCRDHSTHYLYGDAIMGQVRALKDLGRNEDARVLVENFIAQHPESSWTMLAQRELRMIERAAKRAPSV
jgi:outer membrane protein assembly factor BamD (BamD/ComL family)